MADGYYHHRSNRHYHKAKYKQKRVCLVCLFIQGDITPVTRNARYWLCKGHASQFVNWKRRNHDLLAERKEAGDTDFMPGFPFFAIGEGEWAEAWDRVA